LDFSAYGEVVDDNVIRGLQVHDCRRRLNG
jgi:hypothetical protein